MVGDGGGCCCWDPVAGLLEADLFGEAMGSDLGLWAYLHLFNASLFRMRAIFALLKVSIH